MLKDEMNKETKIQDDPLISILVINFNGRKYIGQVLDDCIRSILESEYPKFEVLFLDNGSKDDSIEHINHMFGHDDRLKILDLGRNYGTAGAKNIGIEASKGELIYLLNTDIYLKKDNLRIMSDIMSKHSDIGILGCKLVSPSGELQTEGESFSNRLSLIGSIFPSLYKKTYMRRIKRRDNLNLVEWIVGGALMVRKNIAEYLDQYDEEYFMYSEEVDLAYKVRKLGYEIACINDHETIHYGKHTTKHFSGWQRDLEARNQLLFILKNFEKSELALSLSYLIVSIFFDFIISLVKFDELEYKKGLSKIRAFSYINKPPIVPQS